MKLSFFYFLIVFLLIVSFCCKEEKKIQSARINKFDIALKKTLRGVDDNQVLRYSVVLTQVPTDQQIDELKSMKLDIISTLGKILTVESDVTALNSVSQLDYVQRLEGSKDFKLRKNEEKKND